MESYYEIFKNIYKMYTKRIVSVYKFLIEQELSETVEFSKVLSSTEKNGKES